MTTTPGHVESLKLPSQLKRGDWLFDPENNRVHRINDIKHGMGHSLVELLDNNGDPFRIKLRPHSYVKVVV
jgi:hypothetical protein